MIAFSATILRKQPSLPRYVVVKPAAVEGRAAAFAATVRLNDGPSFARTIRPWGKGSKAFFFNLTAWQCRRSGVDTGDVVCVLITPDGVWRQIGSKPQVSNPFG